MELLYIALFIIVILVLLFQLKKEVIKLRYEIERLQNRMTHNEKMSDIYNNNTKILFKRVKLNDDELKGYNSLLSQFDKIIREQTLKTKL